MSGTAGRFLVQTGFAAFLAGAALAAGQTPDGVSRFEVASIKAADPDHSMSISRSGNRMIFSNYSLEMLILWAYDLRGERLLGKPKGLDSARYDIVAAAPSGGTQVPGQLNRMMQALLAERFGLAVHRETRELPYYEMVVDKGGPRVHVEALAGEMGQNPFGMTRAGHLTGVKVSADMLAKVLAEQTGRVVEDGTGLKGVFDFKLDWAPDSVAASDAQGPSIFTAVREQLGFRLEARKGTVEVVVVDRVANTPTEN